MLFGGDMSDAEKRSAVSSLAHGLSVTFVGSSKFRVGSAVVHARFCSANACAPDKYKFNINPNTLSADYELWVCGAAALYYLMPISFVRGIYQDPNAYNDRLHPGIKVVSVDAAAHRVTYATGGVSSSLSPYLRAQI